MSYIDGFVIAVPTPSKQEFINHAKKAGSVFKELGATRISNAGAMTSPTGSSPTFARPFRRKRTRRSFSPGSVAR